MAPEPDAERLPRWPRVLAWALAALFLVIFVLVLWMDRRVFTTLVADLAPFTWVGLHGVWVGPFIVFAAVGAMIASRRPDHPIGWVMLAAALASVSGEAANMYAAMTLGVGGGGSATLARWLKLPADPVTVSGILLGLVVIPVLFPTGRPLTRRWRLVLWGAGLFLLTFLLGSILSPRITDSLSIPGRQGQVELYDVANPVGAEGVRELVPLLSTATELLIAALVIFAGVAVIVRFRRSDGAERKQMKWFVFAAALVGTAVMALVVSSALAGGGSTIGPFRASMLVAGLSAYPVAIGVAVLRYRLYEIDRIISRTVSYGLVIAILGAVYVGAVVGLGAVATALTGAEDSDLVVALSTVLAAGLFQPVRTRVQTAVDRRFNRTGYEARQAVEAFTRDVRDEVDLEQIRQQVAETAAVAAQPTTVSVWLPAREEAGS